mgnify:CR=1 FL=1
MRYVLKAHVLFSILVSGLAFLLVKGGPRCNIGGGGWESSYFGYNPALWGMSLGGTPFWEESRFGRNPVSGGIPSREESHFGRKPISGGIPFWEESQAGGVLREGSRAAEILFFSCVERYQNQSFRSVTRT